MISFSRIHELADVWAFVVGHIAWQATAVVLVVLILASFGKRWPSPVRHGLLLLAMLKFVIPPVTNLPVGVFSIWSTESSINELDMTAFTASEPRLELSQVSMDASPQRRRKATDFHMPTPLSENPSIEIEAHKSGLMRKLLIASQPDEEAAGHAEFANDTRSTTDAAEVASENVGFAPESSRAIQVGATNGTADDNASHTSMTFSAWLMTVHGLGSLLAAVALFWKARTLRYFIASASPAPEDTQSDFSTLRNNLGCRSGIELRITRENVAPFSAGVLSPVVVISEDQLNFLHASQLRAVLLHELVHHRRHDLLVCWCQAIVTMIWWFHPAVWIVNRQIRGLREDCCDDFLLCRRSVEPDVYCETLLNVARGVNDRSEPLVAMTVSMAHGVHALNSRFCRIMDDRQTRNARISLAGAMGLLVVGLLFIPGMTTVASRAQDSVVNSTEVIVLASPQEGSTTEPIAADPTAVVSRLVVPSTVPSVTETNVKGADQIEPETVAATWPESIRITVLDPTGKPIAGAKVIQTINRPETEFITNADGEATVSVPEDYSKVTYMSILADAAPYVVFEKYWYPQRWPERPIEGASEFRLEDGQTVGGRVLNVDNQPIVGAKVHVKSSPENGNRLAPRPTSYTFVAETDGAGSWTQDRIPKSLAGLALQVRHPDYVSNPEPFGIEKESWAGLFERQYPTVLKTDSECGTTLTTDELGRAELSGLNEPCTIIAVTKPASRL